MKPPALIIRQDLNTHEARTIGHAALVDDIPVRSCSMDDLAQLCDALRSGALPVGSVAYLREAMRLAGIAEPASLSYHEALRPHLGREIRPVAAGSLRTRCFVKPVQTKAFTGFVFDPDLRSEDYDDHDQEQLKALRSLPSDAPVWISDVVDFAGEWRCYVIQGQVIGAARYDPDGADSVEPPDAQWIDSMAKKLFDNAGLSAFSLDVGRLEDGRCVLVEVNDAWAIGLYGRALEPRHYLELLWTRWTQLYRTRT